MNPTIAVIGTGRMGTAIATAFLNQGHSTIVWNRTRSKAERLASSGARIAGDVLETADAELVIVILDDYGNSDRLLRTTEMTAALRGKTVVQLVSGSPRLARDWAAWAKAHAIRYLDGAILATPEIIGQAEATILYAGAQETYDIVGPILRGLAGNSVHVGTDPGQASAMDSAILVFMWAHLFGLLQAAAIVRAEELSLEMFMDFVNETRGTLEGMANDLGRRIIQGRLAADGETHAGLDVHHISFRHMLELCEDKGIDLTIPKAFGDLFRRAIDGGDGQADFAALSRYVR